MTCGNKYIQQHYPPNLFQTYFENYTWGEIYCNITKALIRLCTSMKVNMSLQKMSRLLDNKYICSKQGLIIDDLVVQRRKHRKAQRKGHNSLLKVILISQIGTRKDHIKQCPEHATMSPKISILRLKEKYDYLLVMWIDWTYCKQMSSRKRVKKQAKRHKNMPPLEDLESTSMKKYP